MVSDRSLDVYGLTNPNPWSQASSFSVRASNAPAEPCVDIAAEERGLFSPSVMVVGWVMVPGGQRLYGVHYGSLCRLPPLV